MKVSKGQSQPETAAATFVLPYMILAQPFSYRVLIVTHVPLPLAAKPLQQKWVCSFRGFETANLVSVFFLLLLFLVFSGVSKTRGTLLFHSLLKRKPSPESEGCPLCSSFFGLKPELGKGAVQKIVK